MAFSDTDEFPFNLDRVPDPMISWLETERELIEHVREEMTLIRTPEIKLEWDLVLHRIPQPNGDDDPCGINSCPDTFVEKAPLLTTSWGQGATYNNLVPMNCPNSSGGKAPTGCVATAMAQVMKYHQYPPNYNWSAMPNFQGSSHTQQLMVDIGNAVSMEYGCNGSGANTESSVANALTSSGFYYESGFDYSDADYTTNYNVSLIKQQLNWNKPVILRGGRKRNGITWPWNYYTGGHAWVCDGYRSYFINQRDENGCCTGVGFGFVYLHMNWGWDGQFNNTWYNSHNFNPGNQTYNYKRGIVYNITP